MRYVGIDILGPLRKSKQDNQFVVVMTDRYTNLTKPIQTTNTNANTVARIFIEYWVASFGIPYKVVTDNGPQFVAKFF